MSGTKEEIDLSNPFGGFKYGMKKNVNCRQLWSSSKENWKNKEHIARLTLFYTKNHPSKVIFVFLAWFLDQLYFYAAV